MRVLIDECVDPGIRDFLSGHEVMTVAEAKWLGAGDNELVSTLAPPDPRSAT